MLRIDEGALRSDTNGTHAAEFLGISRSKVYELMDGGQLTSLKLGRCRRIPRRALVELVAGALRSAE
jgi:excisionase family DNA binding protein